jgi:ATP/maltotriose-dependent transcriptional regulator MalT
MAAVLQQCRAEHARLHGRTDPAAWAAAAAGWEALGQPYPVACSGWREAEMLLATRAPRAQAERALQAAHQVAVRLGAAPLRRELERLAERGRLRLEAPAEPAMTEAPMTSIAASFGLTPREAEVLALVAAGRTNRQIGQQLFITPRPPASTSQGSSPSSGSRAAERLRPSPTGSVWTSNDRALSLTALRAKPA